VLAITARLLIVITFSIRGFVITRWRFPIATLGAIAGFGIVKGFIITIRCRTIIVGATPV
jgi:hypothetical protein